METEMLN